MHEPSGPAGSPVIRALSPRECETLLARNHIGRLAFAFHDRVDIQPVHYVHESRWLYGRTSEGTKLTTLAHNPWVAFEVDEIRGLFDWESVVARGAFHRLDPSASPREAAAAEHAVHLLRTLVPETLSADDPVPFRTVLFRIALDEVTGRAASYGPARTIGTPVDG